MKKLLFVALVLITLFSLVTLSQMQQIGTIPLKVSSVTIDCVTPYDHGVIVLLSYTNHTPSKDYTVFYVYFLNSTTKLLLYNFTLTAVGSAFSFVKGGELYVTVITTRDLSFTYVFKGLMLIKRYIINGIIAYERSTYQPLHNLSALVIEKGPYVTLILNETNITFFNQCPIIALKLPNGIFTVSANFSRLFFEPHAVPYNFTLFSYDGKIIWSKKYYICNMFSMASPNLPMTHMFFENFPSAYLLLDLDFATIVGDQLFILNATPVPIFGINKPINATVLGINLENGKLVNEIKLTDVTIKNALLNIGDKLYVISFLDNDEVVVERYNGTGLSLVTKIPLTLKEIKLGLIKDKIPLTGFFYDFGKYLVIVSPSLTGSNVTDIYFGGITHYLIGENITSYYISSDVILLNESGNFSLMFLNSNGTLKGTVSLNELSPSDKFIYFAEVNPYKYYVVAYTNEVVVYEVTAQKPSSFNWYLASLIVIAVTIVVLVVVLVRRRRID